MEANVFIQLLIFAIFLSTAIHANSIRRESDDPASEDEALAFLQNYDRDYSQLLNAYSKADWNYNTNLTDENAAIVGQWSSKLAEYAAAAQVNASRFDSSSITEVTRRQLKKVGSKTLDPDENSKLTDILSRMGKIYGTHKVCKDDDPAECMGLDPELNQIMAESRDAGERLWAWRSWHTQVGRLLRPLYVDYVTLKNKLARLNGYEDYGDQWRQKYETKELESDVRRLYRQVEPLYKQLHAYIRRKLYETYGPDQVDLKGPLPAHLLGDMWGRFWSKLNPLAQPFKQKMSVDPTDEMIRRNFTVRHMFELGDDFFRSMGLKKLPDTFFRLSMLEKPSDRQVACHATAWDFSDGADYRIKMCAKVNFDDFLTIHHELGHVQYFQQYAHQPVSYRDGANDGFHEAIGELMSMSVATTQHLRTLGLLGDSEDDPEVDINFLLAQSLSSVSTLPFHLVQDSWRWKVFSGQIPQDQWNDAYWKEKVEVVGVSAPVARDSSQDLDVVALYHVCNDYDMIRYFMRTVMQFQFAEALCNAADHRGPLYKCDIYNSTAAGAALSRMLRMGSSRPWPEAMEALTGQRQVSARPLLNYFEPLRVWLEKENARNGELVGWEIGQN